MSSPKDFTQGSVLKHIWTLALPTMIAFALQTSFNIVDTIFVGRLGADAVAAISIVFPVVILMIALGAGTGIGASSLVARYLGAKKVREAGRVAEHALFISMFFAILFGLLGWFFSEHLFVLMGATPSVLSLAMDYSRWIFGFGGFIFIFITLGNILRGEGDAKTPMKFMIIAVLINAALDPLLIFGLWFFPALGVEGAAISTIISRGIGCMLLVSHFLAGKSSLKMVLRKFKYSFNIIKGIFSVGIPASLSHMMMSVGMIFVIKIISSFGPAAIAVYGIGSRLEGIAFHFSIGISIATVALVGHNFGAGKVKRARKVTWVASGLSMAVAGLIGLVFLLAPRLWFRIFTTDALVLEYGVSYLKIVSWFFVFISLGMILEGAFQGFGRGMPKFFLTILRLGVLAIPLAYVLSKTFGLVGVWYGLVIANVVNGLVAVLWFKFSDFNKSKGL